MIVDTLGKVVSCGDVISIATNRFGKLGATHDITKVESISFEEGIVTTESGEDIDIKVYDILVLPFSYLPQELLEEV